MSGSCPREPEVVAAARAGELSPELLEHTDACRSCGDLMLVTAALGTDSRQIAKLAGPPSTGTVWFRLERRRNEERMARALRPIRLAGKVAVAAVSLAAALLAVVYGRGLLSGLGELDLQTANRWLSAESAILSVSLLLVAILVLVNAEKWRSDY